MQTLTDYTIEPYHHGHDAGLAAMWNASDDQWPGTFTRGVAMTAEGVTEWMDKIETLLRLVVRAPDGAVVGYGSLWDEPTRSGETCYVDLLNVQPGHQGRSLCRHMLTQMVDYAIEHGYGRLMLGTWSANLKAVPLYKKTGFFWRPDTSVLMENYIPMVRRLAVTQRFFANADWYQHYDRALQQNEDQQRHPQTGDMAVYICRWVRPNGAFIEAVVDREAQALTGLETPDFAAYAVVEENKPAQGLTYPIRWTITNKRATALPVSLRASADTGISVDCAVIFTLQPGESRTIPASYRCAVDAPSVVVNQYRPRPLPQIKSEWLIDGEPLHFASAIHYRPAAAVKLHPAVPTLLPGQERTIHLQVRNHLKQAMTGELQIMAQTGVTADWQTQRFSAAAESEISVPVTLRAATAMAAELTVAATFVNEGRPVTTAPKSLPLLVRGLGAVAAVIEQPGQDEQHLYIENDFFRLEARQKAGRVAIHNKADSSCNSSLNETLGPPFAPAEFWERYYDLALESGPGFAKATFTIVSNTFPGVILRRSVLVTAGPLIEVRQWLENSGATEQRCKIQTTVNLLEFFDANAQSAMARSEGVITGLGSTFPAADDDFPSKPAGVAEQWVAHSVDGQVHGAVWDREIGGHEWLPWFLDLNTTEQLLPPGTLRELPPIQIYCGPGDWRDVRRIWQQRRGQLETEELENGAMPVATTPYRIGLTPSPVLTLADEVAVTLQVENVRKQAISGAITLVAPAGWQANRTTLALNAVVYGAALQEQVTLTNAGRIGPALAQLQLTTRLFDETIPVPLLRLGDERQTIHLRQTERAGHHLWVIDNGHMSWTVAPTFHGGVIDWRETGSAVNHLFTSFPNEGELAWMKPWLGGIRPLLHNTESSWPGKLHVETFSVAPVDAPDGRGLPWRGLRLTALPTALEALQGLRAEIEYLSLPGSNVLKLCFRLINISAAYRSAYQGYPGFMAGLAVDGDHTNGILHGVVPRVGAVQRKRGDGFTMHRIGTWGAVVNAATGRAATVIIPTRDHVLRWMDGGKLGGHFMLSGGKTLAPQAHFELVAYVALADSLDEARLYECLGEVVA